MQRRAQGYAFEDADGGQTWQASGQELMEKGLAISIGTPRASRLVFFSVCRNETPHKPPEATSQ